MKPGALLLSAALGLAGLASGQNLAGAAFSRDYRGHTVAVLGPGAAVPSNLGRAVVVAPPAGASLLGAKIIDQKLKLVYRSSLPLERAYAVHDAQLTGLGWLGQGEALFEGDDAKVAYRREESELELELEQDGTTYTLRLDLDEL